MAYTTGTASDYLHLFEIIRGFLVGTHIIENYVETPDDPAKGFVKGAMPLGGAVDEVWTIVCTIPGGAGVAQFSVDGSVSGSQTSLIAKDDEGTEYYTDGNEVTFKVVAGGSDFEVGDQFTFEVLSNPLPVAQRWTQLDYKPGIADTGNRGMNVNPAVGATYANELYLKGPGLAGADEVYVSGFTHYDENSDWYNLAFQGAAGYDALQNFENQPHSTGNQNLPGWQFQIPYWIVASGRRFIVVAKVSTVYVAGYWGLILPYATPTEYPYPMFVGGAHNDGIRWSSESHNHRSFFDPYRAFLYTVNNTWMTFANKENAGGSEGTLVDNNVWPYAEGRINNIRQSPGDVYPMLPMILHTVNDGGNVYGELEGCFWTPGFANASENVIVLGGFEYFVFQNVYRTSNGDYFALKME